MHHDIGAVTFQLSLLCARLLNCDCSVKLKLGNLNL